MKKHTYIKALLALALLGTGCSDKFLEEKRDLGAVNEEVFQDPVLGQAYIDYVYGLFLPANNGTGFVATNDNTDNGSYNMVFAQTTDEFGGETDYNKPWGNISYQNNHVNKYFGQRMTASVGNNTWTRMRQINLFLTEVDKYNMPEEAKNKLKGQMYFWRGWQYYELMKLYGGVPLVLTAQNPTFENNDENSVPRSSTSATVEQIIADLDSAMALLPGRWSGADWGRITSGAAAAVKGRMLLTWASPLFNPNDDIDRWQRAYDANLAAKELLEENGFGLFQEGNLANGEAWGNMWMKEEGNPEAVIVYGFNKNPFGSNITKNSGWEQEIRPRNIHGSGSISPTKQIVEGFPMKDGKAINDASSAYTYDANKFYKNRDPRFYQSFAYNGAVWPYGDNENYTVWTYFWKPKTGEANKPTEIDGANGSGIYVRKGSNLTAKDGVNNFKECGTDFMELRFAEVILNLAESAIGVNKLNEGLQGIEAIRERAGVENKDGAFGLADIAGNRDALFKAVLDERKVEFAFEGKRFHDLRRWMLFDNATGMNDRLGIPVLTGTRRTGYQILVKDYVGDADPFLATDASGAPVVDRAATPDQYPAGVTTQEEYVDYLYDHYFEVKERDDLDRKDIPWTFTWYPEYYHFGLSQELLQTSPYLEQTKGWDSASGMGTFDPLK